MRKLTWVAALALALGLVAAGCGGDGNDDDTDTGTTGTVVETLSKAEFLEQGNEICKQGNKKINQAFESLGNNPSDEQVSSTVTEEITPTIQDEIDEIRQLGAPEGDEDQVNAILDAAQKANDKLEADPTAVTDEGTDPFNEANKLANEYGLTECGSG